MGKSETSYSELLVPIIVDKLPTEIQRNLARECSNSQWILADLMAAIVKEIRVLECGHNPQQQQFFRSTAAFVVSSRDYPSKKHRNSSDTKRKQQCIFCKGPHPAHNCEVVTNRQKRIEIVKEGNLCYNCLRCRNAHLSSAAGNARGSTILAFVAVTHQLNLLHQRTRVILAIHLLPLQVNFYHQYHALRLPRTLLVSSKLLLHP